MREDEQRTRKEINKELAKNSRQQTLREAGEDMKFNFNLNL
jgi:hypothetical protein